MKTKVLGLFTGAFIAIAPGLVFAQVMPDTSNTIDATKPAAATSPAPAPADVVKIEGVISAFDKDAKMLTIRDTAGVERKISVPDTARVQKGKEATSLAEAPIGEAVIVKATMKGDLLEAKVVKVGKKDKKAVPAEKPANAK